MADRESVAAVNQTRIDHHRGFVAPRDRQVTRGKPCAQVRRRSSAVASVDAGRVDQTFSMAHTALAFSRLPGRKCCKVCWCAATRQGLPESACCTAGVLAALASPKPDACDTGNHNWLLRLENAELAPASPALAAELTQIVAGLGAVPATISPKYFYDADGSVLFERITCLPEYYLTRTERAIMQAHGDEIGRLVGSGATVIELGAGNCEKARRLCALIQPTCFVAVDISADFLHQAVGGLRHAFPALDVRPVVADLMGELALPDDIPAGRRLVFYPGSSIGNFDPPTALVLLRRMRGLLALGGALLIGVDLVKDATVLEAAYDDAAGVTAAFNLNVLKHLNRLLGADFDLADWRHRALFNREQSRIQMHLEARADTQVTWPGGGRHFRRGECIHTENSYKYRVADFADLLERAGFASRLCWTDPGHAFAVLLARP